MADVEEVNADEVAELERLAEQATQAAKLQPPERKPAGTGPIPEPNQPIERMPTTAPPPPLRPFVDVATVEAHLHALDAKLDRIEAQSRHAMLLAMIVADRLRVTAQEYTEAIQKTERAEQAAKEPR